MTQKGAGNSFGTLAQLNLGKHGSYNYHSLKKFAQSHSIARLPFSLKILLENLLRHEDGVVVTRADIEALVKWDPKAEPDREIQFVPARVVLQDFTGVPAVADLAAMRDAMKRLGGDPSKINPRQPADLVVDHSVQVDYFGTPDAAQKNADVEFTRNRERYEFLKWGQSAFRNFRVIPPDTGIVHQVNLEYLARVTMTAKSDTGEWAYPDTVIGTDSHTTMINGIGVVGWGVGGIEAEAAMLGQPVTMLIPQVIGFKLTGKLPLGTTATDLVLTVTQLLRKKGVVGKFVEFYGPGVSDLPLADRATISNMAPEYGATIGLFPIDDRSIQYLKLTSRPPEQVELVEKYFKEQGLWFNPSDPTPDYTDTLELDLSTVRPSLAGPARPQDRVDVSNVPKSFSEGLPKLFSKDADKLDPKKKVPVKDPSGASYDLTHGSVVIAAITSCTNTSNPSVLMAAGLLAQKAVARGLTVKPWVKTSLAPGSKTVTEYLQAAGLLSSLEALKFHVVGYGCTTCIGNSGPLPECVAAGVTQGDIAVVSVLSGNRNFEGRISPHVRANYLASPPLVVAYAIAGDISVNLERDPIGKDRSGKDVFLKDIWPTPQEVADTVTKFVTVGVFHKTYSDVLSGDASWKAIQVPKGDLYSWDSESTYIKQPPFFEGMTLEPKPIQDIKGARVLAHLGDSITTDHISPAGNIAKNSPAGLYLKGEGVSADDFNSYGARRGNHEVMMRGTFGNTRIKNKLVPGVEGFVTRLLPEGTQTTIYEASVKYRERGTPLVIFAGKEYGTGSSRDWAAKGTLLLGVRAVISQSFERIHRSNLIGMGVLPLEFENGQSTEALGLDGTETIEILGLKALTPRAQVKVRATKGDGKTVDFNVRARIDTPNELEYFNHGGILPYVLRQTLKGRA